MRVTEPTPQPTPWHRVFLLVSGALLIFFGVLVVALSVAPYGKGSWKGAVRAQLASSTQPNALEPISQALLKADHHAIADNLEALQILARRGTTVHPEVDALLVRSAPVVELVSRAAQTPTATFPNTSGTGALRPQPPYDELSGLGVLLVANARRMEGLGRHEEAVQRLVESALFASRFARPYDESTLTSHVTAVSLMDLSFVAMNRVLQGRQTSDAARSRLATQLHLLEQQYTPVAEAIRAEADYFARVIEQHSGSPRDLATGLLSTDPELSATASTDLANELFSHVPTFQQEHRMFVERVMDELRRPYHEQVWLDEDWFDKHAPNKLVRRAFKDMTPIQVREGVMLARLRAVRAAVLLSVGNDAEAKAVVDPFSGKPLIHRGGLVYSIGPDRKDDGGEMYYFPREGPLSIGDVISRSDLKPAGL